MGKSGLFQKSRRGEGRLLFYDRTASSSRDAGGSGAAESPVWTALADAANALDAFASIPFSKELVPSVSATGWPLMHTLFTAKPSSGAVGTVRLTPASACTWPGREEPHGWIATGKSQY